MEVTVILFILLSVLILKVCVFKSISYVRALLLCHSL